MSTEQPVYFAPVLPWQQTAWDNLIARYERLPHGLLFAGMQGIGKRAFVWRFVAWLLCDNREQPSSQQGACGQCQSCQWLASGTHPDLQVLPISSLPSLEVEAATATKGGKSNTKKASENEAAKASVKPSIKIDDIRELQPFISQGSSGRRVCVIDYADKMTVAAANALLKTLEEPREGIHLLLISDMPTKLLPTIRSRVQQVAMDPMAHEQVFAYLENHVSQHTQNPAQSDNAAPLSEQVAQALKLSNGAPLAALEMLSSAWYQQRGTWVKVWLALRAGKRSAIAASDYWQKQLSLDDFIKLSEFMLMDFSRQCLGMPTLQQDLALAQYQSITELKLESIQALMTVIEDVKIACQQNVNDKMAYDQLLAALALL